MPEYGLLTVLHVGIAPPPPANRRWAPLERQSRAIVIRRQVRDAGGTDAPFIFSFHLGSLRGGWVLRYHLAE